MPPKCKSTWLRKGATRANSANDLLRATPEKRFTSPLVTQNGSHPNLYHDFVLENMKRAAREAGKSKEKFLKLYEKYVKSVVRKNPDMLNKAYWQE